MLFRNYVAVLAGKLALILASLAKALYHLSGSAHRG